MIGYDFVKNARFTHHDVAYEVRQVNGDGGVVIPPFLTVVKRRG